MKMMLCLRHDMDSDGTRRVDDSSEDPRLSPDANRWNIANVTSSGEVEQLVKNNKLTSQQQAKNDQLFVTIQSATRIIETLEKCVNNGADINAVNARGETVLDIAIQNKCYPLITYLIGRGGKTASDIVNSRDGGENIEDNNKNAYQNTNAIIVDQMGSDDHPQKQLLRNADHEKQLNELESLLKQGGRILTENKLKKLNAQLESGLEIQEVKKALIRCGIDVNYQDTWNKAMSAVDIAWEYGYYDAMLMLLENDSKFPKNFFNYLDEFFKNCDIPETLKSFVRERQALHKWIRNDEYEKVQNFVSEHHLAYFFNCVNKSALEIAVEFVNVNTIASLIALELPSQKISLSEEQSKLLLQLDTEGNTLLSIAAKNGNKKTVEFFITCGVPINHCNKFEESAVDLAWRNGHFDVVHTLLNADSDFPREFDLDLLNVAHAKALRQFVKGRNLFHELVTENNLDEIKEIIATHKSTLYLNSEGKSALVTALKSKSFGIYAFLKSIGFVFKTEDEKEYINKLTSVDKHSLKTAMIREFPQVEQGHIFYLISKSRSKKPIEDFIKLIENIYRKLDSIPEVSIVLKVLQYIDYLDIVFDFECENIKDINPMASDTTAGEIDYKESRIYISAKNDENKLAGTLAHELTHLAMYVLYKNDCNPFDEDINSSRQFKGITNTIRQHLKEVVDRMNGNEDSPIVTLARVFTYPINEQESELIVRVPHILAQYSAAGRFLFTNDEKFKLLLDFYNDQGEGGFIYRCKEVIENNFLIKPRKSIQFFNETVGKNDNLLKCWIQFENCIDFNNFLNCKKQVFILETESIFLSMLNVYESLILRNKKYSIQDSFFLEFNSFIEKETEILQLVYSPAGKVLCISFSSDSNKEQLLNALHTLRQLLELKPNKKIIFIIQESETEIFDNITNIFNDNYEKSKQSKFTLNNFTKETQQKLLEREITFQEETLTLFKLIDILDLNAKTVIDTNILVKLIKGERVEIGRKPPDTSDLEGAYSELYQEVNMNTFIDKLLARDSKEIYIISGLSGCDKPVSLLHSLIDELENIDKRRFVNNLISCIDVLDEQAVTRHINKSIQVTGNQFKSKHFKQICHNHSKMKINWIHLRNEIDKIKFILQQIYNPDFYLTGKRINREVVLEKSIVKDLLRSTRSEKFIICMNQEYDIQEFLQLKPNFQNNRIGFVHLQDDNMGKVLESFKNNQTNENIHFLKYKEENLIWYKSYGSLNRINKYRVKDYKNIEPLIEENDAIKIIQDNKVSIISGDPGTGKSTIITRLYNTNCSSGYAKEESIVKSHWVIRINLKDHVAMINKMSLNNNDPSEITEFLLQAEKTHSDDTFKAFSLGLLSLSLKKDNFKKPLLIAFDGFDEVLDEENRDKIISLLQYLKDNTYAKICITTRLHYEWDLEDALSTFALRLEPMDDSTIRKFITKSLNNRLSLKLSQDKFTYFFDRNGRGMLKYTDAFLRKMKDVFKNDITKFIGTPLQLYLMLENAIESFQEWMNDSSKNPDFGYLGNDIWEVYENFVAKKYECFCKKHPDKEKKLHQESIKNFDKYHKDLAKSLIHFKSDVKEYRDTFLDIILSVGILRSDGNHLGFIHPTFTEYFAAKLFVYWIRKWEKKSNCGFINLEKQKYFFGKILREPDYRVIRAFLEAKLLKDEIQVVALKKDCYDVSIVLLATKENHYGIAKFVLDNFPDVDINDCEIKILNKSLESRNKKITELFLEKGANVNAEDIYGLTPLYLAVIQRRLDIVRLLIDNGAYVNAIRKSSYYTVLNKAAEEGYLEIVELLIERGANINAVNDVGQTALHLAAAVGQLEVVKLLIDKGADINAVDCRGQTALSKVIKASDVNIVEWLIHKGANVNAADNCITSVLSVAVECGHVDIVKTLLKSGANINAVDITGQTPLHVAARKGRVKMIKCLVENSADVNALDNNEQTALFIAVEYRNLETAKYLMERDGDINRRDKEKKTVLHVAAKCGMLEIVERLVENGAIVNAKDNSGQTAFALATYVGYSDTANYLRHKGGNYGLHNRQGLKKKRRKVSRIVKYMSCLGHT